MGRLQAGVRRGEIDQKLDDLRKELMGRIEALEEQVASITGTEVKRKPSSNAKKVEDSVSC